MEKTVTIAGVGMTDHFAEDSPQSARPQASSTFMLSKIDFDLKDQNETVSQSKHESATTALSSTSSLGVLDLDKQSLFSNRDDSLSRELEESLRQNRRFVDEQRSVSLNRFQERLSDISRLKKSNNAAYANETIPTFDTRKHSIKSDLNFINDAHSSKPQCDNSFANISNASYETSSSFKCGKSAVLKLDADQKENRTQCGSLPVSPINISTNSENTDEREKLFTEFVKLKSYASEEISNVLRNITNKESNNVKLMPSNAQTITASKTEQISSRSNTSSKIPVLQQCDQPSQDPSAVGADSTVLNDEFDESRAYSIASINQIAETLRRTSLMAEPKLAIEHLLSIGKSKPKFIPCVTPCKEPTSNAASSVPSTCSSVSTVRSVDNRNLMTPNIHSGNRQTPSTLAYAGHDVGKVCPRGEISSNERFSRECTPDARSFTHSVYSKTSQSYNKYFQLVKTISPLEIIDNDCGLDELRDFWKLNPLIEPVFANGKHTDAVSSTASILEAYNKKLRASMQETRTAPVRRITLSHNLTIADDVLDDSSCSDTINAGVLCIGTQVEVIITVENPCNETLKYKMSLKSIVVKGETNFSAASVVLVSNKPDIILAPNVENDIKIMLSPLVLGRIDVILELISEEKKFMNIIRQIRVVGEKPQIEMINPKESIISFELLPERTTTDIRLFMMNKGCGRLPVKLSLKEANKGTTCCGKTIIEPADTFECKLCVSTFDIPNDVSSILNVNGELIVQLDTFEGSSLSEHIVIHKRAISANIGRTSLRINENAPLILNCAASARVVSQNISVVNDGIVALDVALREIAPTESEFTIEPANFKLAPGNRESLKVEFKPRSNKNTREVDVNFTVSGSSKTFSLKIIGNVGGSDSVASTPSLKQDSKRLVIPPSNCSSNSSVGAGGPLELDCSHKSISWVSVPLHTKNVRTIILRNRRDQREKLLLTITDSHGAFKFVEDEQYHRNMKLTLESKENRKLNVVFMPVAADQAMNGKIVILRRQNLDLSSDEIQKRVIPLYGIGGKAKISFVDVFRDNESRLWITPSYDSFEAKFMVENSGDSIAFVKMVLEDADDCVSPEELVLLPSECSEIHFSLCLDKDRLECLCKQNPQKEILLANKISVFSGCESTRLRLKKMWLKEKPSESTHRIRDKMEVLVNTDHRIKVQVDSLIDAQSCLSEMWYEGISEHTIGVLVPQQYLESVCFEPTITFNDLDNTVAP